MRNKIIFLLLLLIALLLTSCRGEEAVGLGDYKKLKDEYADREIHGIFSSVVTASEPPRRTPDSCPHDAGYGYIKDADTHTYVCKRCGKPEREAEPHTDVVIPYVVMRGGYRVYPMSCSTCSNQPRYVHDGMHIGFVVSEKSMEEIRAQYEVTSQ